MLFNISFLGFRSLFCERIKLINQFYDAITKIFICFCVILIASTNNYFVNDRGNMPNIYNYLDYRQFLEDFYKEKKKKNPKFSYQVIANIAGFKAKSHYKGIIDGSRNLTTQSIPKMNKVLKLTDKQFAYFSDLVAFNHEKKFSKKYSFPKAIRV